MLKAHVGVGDMADLLEENWITSSEAEKEHGVPPHLIYRWGPRLEKEDLAIKLAIGGRGLWLLSPEGLSFLRTRVGAMGRPPEDGRALLPLKEGKGET